MSTYTMTLSCDECGREVSQFIEPGETIWRPECSVCEKAKATFCWPDMHTLLAVYGAPGNWPVEAAA